MLNQEKQGKQNLRQSLINSSNSRELQYSQSICNSQSINIQSIIMHKENTTQFSQQHFIYFDDPTTFQQKGKTTQQQIKRQCNFQDYSPLSFLNESNSNVEIEMAYNEKSLEIIFAKDQKLQTNKTIKSVFQQQRCFDSNNQLRSSCHSYYKTLTQKLLRLSQARIQLEETQFLEKQPIPSSNQINSQQQQQQSQSQANSTQQIQQHAKEYQCENVVEDNLEQLVNQKQAHYINQSTQMKQKQQNKNYYEELEHQIAQHQKRSQQKSSSSGSLYQKSQENQTNDNNQFDDDISNPIEMQIAPVIQNANEFLQNKYQQVINTQKEQLLSLENELPEKNQTQNKYKTGFLLQTQFTKPLQLYSIKTLYSNFQQIKQTHQKSYKLHIDKTASQNFKEHNKIQKIQKILKYQLHPIHAETIQIISYY